MKWFQDSARDSPSQEKSGFDVDTHDSGDLTPRAATSQTPVNKSPRIGFSSHLQSSSTNETFIRPGASPSTHKSSTSPTSLKFSTLRRAFPSSPDPNSDARSGRDGNRWSMIRSLIPKIISQHREEIQTGPSVASHSVNITDELITGGLATLMLRLWFERDEKDHRRIPVLLHRLRIRVSDSLHPLHGHKSVFRIECDVTNVLKRNVDKMPEFPRTSLRYLKFLKKEGRDVSQTDFARLQRESLENYLIELIRAVMFHPSSNRLAAFLEISALSLATAQSGGCQYKAGYLEIAADGLGGGFGRKSAGWRARKASRWCAIRESYLVVMEEPGELTIWDVFLLDPEFEIERPKRYYRQGLNLLHIEGPSSSHKPTDKSVASQAPPAMLDPSTNVNPLVSKNDEQLPEGRDHSEDVSKHTFYVTNAQMRLKLFARNERQMLQWITAFEKVAATSHYVGKNRFDSFAPIRLNVAAQWLVDGRDYFWNLSRAVLLARETIYIHDWWLSPELHMRRPGKDRYRLDRLLERKAKEGVKIYIILYQEVSNRTTPTDSNYAKQRLVSLHPNVMVQRSPSHFQTGTFYWAHHEKLCVIDQAIAFMGGLDLCFGRWDTPQHVLVDDTEGTDQPEIWPGKDYSNPRITDFHTLNKPEEDMYDRTKVPRMPWHDVGMQVVGQPARDLARHFVQRWNYLLRIKNHSRTMPFLVPPPEFNLGELHRLGLTGTCEMQICRSAGPWSMGTPAKIEHSVQNAYLKAIQMSEHFVYIENQFFISSTTINDVKVENKIGDAIVHRIIRAYRDGTPWKCCIVIPLLPGFTFPVDHSDASAIRIILECQNRTISRGPNSVFARLRKEGIDPDEYISLFSLRNWAKMRGDVLTTEQVYIHGKVCIVDDRLAIIGSANINERSQRGDRDSELAAVIRDTDMIDCTMAGKPFKVGRFAHTLRVRLMREHLGVNVDALDEEDLMANEPVQPGYADNGWDPDTEQFYGREESVTHIKKSRQRTPAGMLFRDTLGGVNQAVQATGENVSKTTTNILHKMGVGEKVVSSATGDDILKAEPKAFTREGKEASGFASAMVPTLEENILVERQPPAEQIHKYSEQETDAIGQDGDAEPRTDDRTLYGASADALKSPQIDDQSPQTQSGVDDADNEEQAAAEARASIRRPLKFWKLKSPRPKVEVDGFEDPITDAFWKNVWVASAVHNAKIYRKVFRAIPDDSITTWKQYKESVLHHERLNKRPRDSTSSEPVGRVPSETGDENALTETGSDEHRSREGPENPLSNSVTGHSEKDLRPRRFTRGSEPFEKWERDEMEKLLGQTNGHLVLFPSRFLEGEDMANNFLFNADRLLPLPIYD
ncbi:hypothetical protein J132_03610 [Termitomyces sp. J132]|nr:hypothetical protein J132_03610 [Termitomyces sp. J132]